MSFGYKLAKSWGNIQEGEYVSVTIVFSSGKSGMTNAKTTFKNFRPSNLGINPDTKKPNIYENGVSGRKGAKLSLYSDKQKYYITKKFFPRVSLYIWGLGNTESKKGDYLGGIPGGCSGEVSTPTYELLDKNCLNFVAYNTTKTGTPISNGKKEYEVKIFFDGTYFYYQQPPTALKTLNILYGSHYIIGVALKNLKLDNIVKVYDKNIMEIQ